MNSNFNLEHGNFSFLTSVFLGILAFFGDNMEIIIRILVAIGSVATAVMACRYYYYNTKEKKQQINRNKRDGL